MGTLAESVIQGAQQSTGQLGQQTIGNAVQAYQIANQTQMARQDLEIKKQQNEEGKANWLNSQIVNIGRQPEGAARNLMIEGFAKQAPNVFPGFNQDIPKMLQRDSDYAAKCTQAAQAYANGQKFDPAALNGWTTMSTPENIDMVTKNAENLAKIRAAAVSGQATKAQNQQDLAIQGMYDKFDKDPKLPNIIDLGNKLDRDHMVLNSNDPKNPVTYQTVHEVIRNIATVLGNGTVSDSSTASITPMLGDEKAKAIETAVTNNPNRPAAPELVKFAQHMVDRLNGSIDGQVTARANQIAASRENSQFFHNPNLAPAAKQKADFYRNPKQWRVQQAAAPAQAAVPAGGGAPMSFQDFMNQRAGAQAGQTGQ